MSGEPRTVPEQLDAARNGQEFAAVLAGLFAALEQARDEISELADSEEDQ